MPPLPVTLNPFRKLIVKDHLRLIIRQGKSYQADVFAPAGRAQDVRFKRNKGVLTVDLKASANRHATYDIQLTVPTLEEVAIRGGFSEVYHYGTELFPTLRVTKGDFCQMRNFDGWRE